MVKVSGAGSQYPADGLVAEGVVVVTINYRLGFLGYFAHPDLEDTNFGLLDQVSLLLLAVVLASDLALLLAGESS